MSHGTLNEQLSSIRSRWVLRDTVLTVSRAVLFVAPLCLVLGWLDHRLDFSVTWRTVSLAALIAVVAWTFRRHIGPALAQRRDAIAAALRVESAFNRFGGRLVSRVEFGAGYAPPGASRPLIDAMCEQVDRDVRSLPLTRAIDMKPARAPGLAAAALAVMLAFVVIAEPALAGLWVRRTLMPWADAPWPRRTQILELDDLYRVRRGGSLTIEGRTAGRIPSVGELTWRSTGTGARRSGGTVFEVAADGTFRATVGPLLENITLTVSAGDARAADIPVEVVIPPELAAIEAVHRYPAFTHRQPDTEQSGDVRALVGTQIDLTLTADRPTARMEIVFTDAAGERTEPVAMTSDTRGRAGFQVLRRGRYQIRLYDVYDFTTDTPATFVIDPIDNELPTITLLRPGPEHTVTPATRLTLRFEAADDYGVTGAVLHWRRRTAEGEGAEAQDQGSEAIPLPEPRKTWTDSHVWDLDRLELAPGDELAYHLEAHDEGEHLTEEKTGRSATHLLRVVDRDTLRERLEARQREAFSDLDHLMHQQTTSYDEVQVLLITLAQPDVTLLPKDRQRLQIEENRQRRIARQMDRLADRLDAIALELADSDLAGQEEVDRMHDLARGLRALTTGRMRDVIADLEGAQAALAER